MTSSKKNLTSTAGFWISLKALFVWLVAKILLFTVRLRVLDQQNLQEARRSGKPLLYAFWHGRQLGLFKANPEKSLAVMTSLSKDGQMQSLVCKKFGLQVVRGSSSRSALAGLLAMGRKLGKGVSVAVAVDGPTGPVHEAKPGIVALAKVSRCQIVPICVGYKRSWELSRAWDRFQIPRPFTSATVIYGQAFRIPVDSDQEQIAGLTEELTRRLRLICSRADDPNLQP